MKKEKGILGKLLMVAGAFLVTVGVFIFQGMTHADETESGGVGDVGVTINAGDSGSETGDVQNDAEVTAETSDSETKPKCKHRKKDSDAKTDDADETEAETLDEQGDSVDTQGDETNETGNEECENETCEIEECEEENEPTEPVEPVEPTLKTFTLRYNANGGTGAPSAQTCETLEDSCGFVVADSVPVRDGYEFRGWAKDGDSANTYLARSTVVNTSADEPLTLYALWAEIKTYTLMYDVNGGSGAPEIQACKSASGRCSFIVSGATPTRNGFEFLNWVRGEESYTGGTEIVVTETNTILMANWNPIYNFTLNYVSEEGTKDLPDAQKCSSTLGTCTFIIPTKEPVRDGYIFLGWRWEDKPDMRAKSGDEIVVGIDGPLDLKIHAAWSKIYSILNSGEVFGAGERVVLRSTASYSDLEKLTIDEVEVPMEYYVVSQGETTSIVLSNAFSQSLNIGEHSFLINWKDGEAGGVISVSQNEDGTKRFVVVDNNGNPDSINLMYRPKAGAVSKESAGATTDSATDNKESNFDAMRTLVLVAIGAFVVVYIVNRFYIKRKMNFIDEF